MLCQFLVYNKVIQLYIYIYICICVCVCIYIYIHILFHIFSIMIYYRILSVVPCAIQQDLVYPFFFFLLINLFIFGSVGSSLLHAGFLQLQRAGATLHCGAWASHCSGFSCCGAWALGAWASVAVACGLSSCGSQAQLLCGMWDLPRPGLEPVSPALAGEIGRAHV